jgi:hypothetical protein
LSEAIATKYCICREICRLIWIASFLQVDVGIRGAAL